MDKQYFIIDFDSTFIKTEGLDELAKICLENDLKKEKKVKKIEEITRLGMEGKINFEESLQKRIKLLTINKKHLVRLTKILKNKITKSILSNKNFFKKYFKEIYIVSGGFKEFIEPVVTDFGIIKNHIFANTFLFNKNDKVIGYDTNNRLSKKNGKVDVVKKLNLKGEVHIIGDGYTDYQLKENGLARFTAFCENVKRQTVIEKADRVVTNFDEFLDRISL